MSPVFREQEPSSDSVAEERQFGPPSTLARLISFLLARRYFIMQYGDPVPQTGGPYVILANHTSLIDPLIVYLRFAHLHPRPVLDESSYRRFWRLARLFDPIVVPDLSKGGDPALLEQAVGQVVDSLAEGRNVLMWPSGRLQKEGRDALRGRSGVWRVMKAMEERALSRPEMVLVRTEGLWGSRFSLYHEDDVPNKLKKTLCRVLPPFLLFGLVLPRRRVRLMLRCHRPSETDCSSVERLNSIIAAWFAAGNQNAVLVPVIPGMHLPRLPVIRQREEASELDLGPALELLAPYGAEAGTKRTARLAEDLGIDSLAMVQLILQIEKLCAYAPAPLELQTVGDVALVLINRASTALPSVLAEVEAAAIRIPPLAPVHEIFSRRGDVTDITLGAHFPRSGLMAYAKAVATLVRGLPCRRLGIALPPGAAAMVAFAGCLGAGRTPVMLDYTADQAQLALCADSASISHVLTSRRMYGRGRPPKTTAVYLEDLNISKLGRKALASIFGFDWYGALDATAAILFTSGAEGQPKAVPLTHRNLVSNLRALLSVCTGEPLGIRRMSLLCCLPAFHSLGFLSNILLPLVCGVPCVCVADASNAASLAKIALAYKTTLFVGTPTLLRGMLLAEQQALPFKHVMLGMESCPQETRELFAARCPGAKLVEGYGLTECSPVVSLNAEGLEGSVGRVLPGLEYIIRERQLYVRGESVFPGYLDGSKPFVSLGASPYDDWFPTGDFFREEKDALYFEGRASRFVKRKDKECSLDALEAALGEIFEAETARPPGRIAVVAAPDGKIYAVGKALGRIDKLRRALRKAGFEEECLIDAVFDGEVPLLANGKADLQRLCGQIAAASGTGPV